MRTSKKIAAYFETHGDILHDITSPLLAARKPYDAIQLGRHATRENLEELSDYLESAKDRIDKLLHDISRL